MMIFIHKLHVRIASHIFRGRRLVFTRRERNACCVEMSKKGTSSGQSRAAHTFNSDGSQVLDRGVWKAYKYCVECKKIMVMRASWEKNWDSVKVCSEKCRKAAKMRKKSSSE